ncbi:putative lipase atg15 [Coemansia sp. RSA 552]|nr:putative lipase atg15 [Coemansia sp. RSA 552]
MGRPETDTQPRRQTTSSSSSNGWTVLKVLLVGGLLTGLANYFGGPIEMVPWRPGNGATPAKPVLGLREVYMQSTPRPPSALVALSAQGTAAGRTALRAWYDGQAALARERGYSFPFRMRRWARSASSECGSCDRRDSATANGESEGQLTAQHPLSLSPSESPVGPLQATAHAATAADDHSGPERVRASGTSSMLHRMRAAYLNSAHGRRFSYWSATPERAAVHSTSNSTEWSYYIDDGLLVPNITNQATLVQVARMAANAYQPTDSETWEHLGDNWDTHDSFGWEDDGVRGHVFADPQNSTVVLTFKGTSSTFFLGGGSETSARDKYNDNRLFSCCCAYVDFTWSTVCDCHMSGSKCNATCLANEMNDEAADNYFFAAAQIFMDVVDRYPGATVVLTGHSLGGSIATLMGLTFGLPAVGFEAPGDKLAAKRLHLPQAPGVAVDKMPLFHIGHTADPVYMGVCSGRTSSCYYAGYALESSCHNGRQLVFDTVDRRGWRIDIRHHRMAEVIYLVLETWGTDDPKDGFPVLEPEDKECVDCGLWKFVDEDSPQ